MPKLLYANGCSMTYGAELGGIGPKAETEEEDKYRLEHSWPTQLGKMLNVKKTINDGWAGCSNDSILRRTFNWFGSYKGKPEDIFVVIGWTGPGRREVRLDGGGWVSIIPEWIPPNYPMKKITKFYNKFLYDELHSLLLSFSYFISLQSYFKLNRIPYLFFNAIHCFHQKYNNELIHYHNLLDKKNFYGFDEGDIMFNITKEFPCGPMLHPLEKGHKEWAKVLYNYIQKEELLND